MVRQPTSFSIAPIYAPAARSRLKIERFNIAIPCRQQFWPTLGRFSNNHTSTNHPSGANLPRIRLHHKSSFGECVLSVFHARGHHSQRTSLQYFAESRWGNIATASQASNATGVGIQITRLDTPLKFGQNSAAAGNTNQWFAGNAVFGQGKLDIPLKARYLKTVAQVMSGKANGAATFTMSYQ